VRLWFRLIVGGSQLVALVMCLLAVFQSGIMLGWFGAFSCAVFVMTLALGSPGRTSPAQDKPQE
jgi:hypothetical protein